MELRIIRNEVSDRNNTHLQQLARKVGLAPPQYIQTSLPVIVWFYGGGFISGNSSYALYDPTALVEKNVIFVSFNYRLSIFGFISTNDSTAPGNTGLKDQLHALKWVQKNILAFGGDPNRVTIMGQSAGSVSVSYMVLTSLAKGLFKNTIMESGSSLCLWALTKSGAKAANLIGHFLGISNSTSQVLISKLKKVPAKNLLRISILVMLIIMADNPLDGFVYAPVIEPASNSAMITASSFEKLRSGDFTQVPQLVGYTSAEAYAFETELKLLQWYVASYNMDPARLVPVSMRANSSELQRIGKAIKDFYTGKNGEFETRSFLNLPQSLRTPVSVMVWIYGGSFLHGNSSYALYSPTELVREGVIVFSGFLSTNDNVVPGNTGLKDQIFALKWVRNNIKAFGGNPNQITIFGESAGAASVSYLVLSPLSHGSICWLFKRAIMESGTALCIWSLSKKASEAAFAVGATLGINTTSSVTLVKALKNANAKDLHRAAIIAMGTPPQSPDNWTGIWDATYDRNECVVFSTDDLVDSFTNPQGSEDCLYINVYTPRLPNTSNSLLPVMVWIYGGGFIGGNSSYALYGPDQLVSEEVIIVNFNYRLGIFGFLSTDDSVAPGNTGLKDQIFALKWIQNNIKAFGGNPNQVTIFGESAGAASVSYLVLSPRAKGLFHKAIMESGSALCLWALSKTSRRAAFKTGQNLGIVAFTSQDLVKQLKDAPMKELHRASIAAMAAIFSMDPLNGLVFAPVIEPLHDNAVVTGATYEKLTLGNFNQVPQIIGYNSAEAQAVEDPFAWVHIAFFSVIKLLSFYLATYDVMPARLVPASMNANAIDLFSIGVQIRNFYTDGLSSMAFPSSNFMKLPSAIATPLPVMVWIYGGGFIFGGGNYAAYGPDQLVSENVTVVTFNYRLGIFGFAFTDDDVVPGNLGMKDQILALQWVQRNIAAFGGDKNLVTIFGESSGAASVSYLLVSPLAKDLFHHAIMQSGNSICVWSLSRITRAATFRTGQLLGILTISSRYLIGQLKTVSATKLQKAAVTATIVIRDGTYILILMLQYLFEDPLNGFAFAPVIEPADTTNAVITTSTYECLRLGHFNRVPLLMGYNSLEAVSMDFSAGHADELFYLFNSPYNSPNDILTKNRMVKLWTNFAKTGNPTPSDEPILESCIWPKVTPNALNYIDIDNNLTIKQNPRKEDMDFWDKLFRMYSSPPLLTY
ncbi:carboxylesterase [Holotrichia oblita]|uniref:Carboxylesterase n=1 Tax=Holotrichia oblita TaxID=644536 RepID=A0ACB9SYG7_HOLOL|nr:carboxylesterase [Holotrichia oblita]